MYIQCKPNDVQSLQSSYFLVFYHFGFETTTLTFSRIIDFDDATNLFLKQVYSCAVVDACLIWTDIIILISWSVRWDKLYQSTHFKGKLHKLPPSRFNKHISTWSRVALIDWSGFTGRFIKHIWTCARVAFNEISGVQVDLSSTS